MSISSVSEYTNVLQNYELSSVAEAIADVHEETFDRISKRCDVVRAISDMKKDQILQQYQYFVGSAKNLFTDKADGIVLAKF